MQIIKQVLKQRESERVHDTLRLNHDFAHPNPDQLSFENYIIGFEANIGSNYGFNVLMSNGNNSNLPTTQW